MGRINKTRGPRLEALPKTPTPEELKLEGRWISELVRTCDDILGALINEGVIEASDPVLSAIEAGESVPDDVRQPAIDFHNAWIIMFLQLRPMAFNWATRLDDVMELDAEVDKVVAEWAERLGRARDLS